MVARDQHRRGRNALEGRRDPHCAARRTSARPYPWPPACRKAPRCSAALLPRRLPVSCLVSVFHIAKANVARARVLVRTSTLTLWEADFAIREVHVRARCGADFGSGERKGLRFWNSLRSSRPEPSKSSASKASAGLTCSEAAGASFLRLSSSVRCVLLLSQGGGLVTSRWVRGGGGR